MDSDRQGQLIHFDEVAKHNHKLDCWIIISGKVYNVTQFLEEHPGGDEVLLLAAEKDATEDFEDVGHSDTAREMMVKYIVGDIDITTLPERPNYRPNLQAQFQAQESSGGFAKMLQFLLPLLIVAIALGYQFYNKNN